MSVYPLPLSLKGVLYIAGEGKQFEESLETSCNEQGIFALRIRDVNPMAIKKGQSVPKNKYDFILYHKGYLFPVELKSTKAKSFGYGEDKIKQYQLESLKKASLFKGVIPGLIINFREPENVAYFIHINDFLKCKEISEKGLPHTYSNKLNKSSISIKTCEEVGIELKSALKKKYHRFYLNQLLDELIDKYGE